MTSSPPSWATLGGFFVGALVLALACGAANAGDPAHAPLRQRAPIELEQAGAYVLMPLPASTYAQVQQAGLQDLRVVDARGQRVPFALLRPRADEATTLEPLRKAALYPLPPRPAGGAAWPAPVRVVVQGDRVTVTPIGTPTSAPAVAGPPGWLIDLGERGRDEPAPHALRLAWSGPAEFSIGYTLEHSDDMRQWRAAGSGQLMALTSPGGPLTQPWVSLPVAASRFLRLVWRGDQGSAPQLTGVEQQRREPQSRVLDPPVALSLVPSPEPPPPRLLQGGRRLAPDDPPAGALHFDLGGRLPLREIELPLVAPTAAVAAAQVVPLRVQTRNGLDEPWRDQTQGVVYRIERDGQVLRSPPLALRAEVRYLRLIPDPRAPALDPVATRLNVRAELASLVFAMQGEPPLALLAGSADAPAGALPVATLVPNLDEERLRFGRARLGPWSEIPEAARQAAAAQRDAALRPWLLWAVLVGGVAALGLMVWRLARGSHTP